MRGRARPPARDAAAGTLGVRFFAIASLVALMFLLYRFWFGESGWFAKRALEADAAEQTARTAALAERNQTLAKEVRALKAGPEAVEGRARTDLGMVKRGETFYLVVDTEEADTADEDATDAPEASP